MFCKTCGAELDDNAKRCSQCGNNPHAETSQQQPKKVYASVDKQFYKSRLTAGLLQILPGLVGIGGLGRFYLGYTTIGLLQLIIPFPTCGAGCFWSIIDGIMILNGSIDLDANGNPLKD